MPKQTKRSFMRTVAVGALAAHFAATGALAQDIANVPRDRTLVLTPWGDRAGSFSNVENFNPYLISVDHERNIGHLTYNEALFYTNLNNGELVPWLATGYEVSDDFMEATITLREGVTWADGTPFTAEDVAFTIEAQRTAGADVYGSGIFAEWVASAEAVDPLTVRLTFNKPAPRFVRDEIALGHDDLYPILPKHIWEGQDISEFNNYDPERGLPMGTGAYTLVSSGPDQMVFDRRDDWWGAVTGFQDLPAPERIVLTPHSGDDSMGQLLIAGSVDSGRQVQKGTFEAASRLNPAIRSWKAEGPDYGAPDGCSYQMMFNTARSPWDNVDLRWAINHAIDRERLSLLAYEGGMPPTTYAFSGYMADAWLGEGSPLQEKLDEWNLDNPSQDLVDERMAAAGYSRDGEGNWSADGEELRVLIRAPEFIQPLVAPLAQQLRNSGFDAREAPFDDSWRTDTMNGNFDTMIFVHCGSVAEPLDTLQHFHSKFATEEGQPSPLIFAGTNYQNPEYDAIIDQMEGMLASTDADSDYMRLSVEALDIVLRDMPEINILEEKHVVVFNEQYWTGWPSAEDPYMAPYPVWDGWNLIIHTIQPAD